MTNNKSVFKRLIDHEVVEDYSLRYAPKSFRRWSPAIVASASLGSIAALFAFAISASLANTVGTTNALIGNLIAMALVVVSSIPIANAISKHNLDMDLLTRGAGFGYIGSTITSLIYATFTFIYMAFEGSIIAQGITGALGIPLSISYIIGVLLIIPLVMFGMTMLSKLQTFTWPIWIILLVIPLLTIYLSGHFTLNDWLSYKGLSNHNSTIIDISEIGLVAGALVSLMVQIGEQADYLRFMKDDSDTNVYAKRVWTFMAGPGFGLFFFLSFAAGTYLAAYTSHYIGTHNNEPYSSFIYVYSMIFPHWLGALLAFLLVVVAQVKINVINAYSGSLSWSNFFSRILHKHYGRFTWLLLQCIIALILMEANVFNEMGALLGFYSNVAVAWIATISADLVINRKLLNIGPDWIEFRRGYMYNINPVGMGSLIVASTISILAYFGYLGAILQPYSPFISIAIALIATPLIAIITGGKYYIKRDPKNDGIHSEQAVSLRECVKCGSKFELRDMLGCSFHRGAVCSLCCTIESKCGEECKYNSQTVIYPLIQQ